MLFDFTENVSADQNIAIRIEAQDLATARRQLNNIVKHGDDWGLAQVQE